MAPRTDDLSAASPLVASSPTFKEATRTVDYLCHLCVPRRALSIVAEGLRPASEGVRRNDKWRAYGWMAGAGAGLVAGFSVGGPVLGAATAVVCALGGEVATAVSSRARRQMSRAGDREQVIADRCYVISDQASARTARLLLRGGADTRASQFEAHSTPCVGSLPVRLRRRSDSEVIGRPWSARS
jgi:hypothetical protein